MSLATGHGPSAAEQAALPSPPRERDWHAASAAELIDRILVRYHAEHRRQLPELIRLARKVELVHAEDPACPAGLAAQLRDTARELESHMRKEEEVLFPLLARGDGTAAEGAILAVRNEHEEHGHQLRRLVELAHDLTPPLNACASWRSLYVALRAFRSDLLDHIHLENDILFARGLPPRRR